MNRLWLGTVVALALVPRVASARPYVVVHDDGTFLGFSPNLTVQQASNTLMNLYDASGAPRPDVVSVWTTFPIGGESDGTFFLPQANAIKGIGFDGILSTDGTLRGNFGPVNAILLHNNVLALAQRASRNRATSDQSGFAQYLFLLEFSHQWLAAARVPGASPNDLGIWPHWSFWLDSGDSPPGGNRWTDNGDGTFSTVPVNPADVKYSSLDLYLMGLVAPGAVTDFKVLQNPVAPAAPTDPLFGGKYAAHSLTDFDPSPLTVTATSKSYTIDDLVAANGVRNPATSPNSTTLGIVLMLAQDAGANEVDAAQAIFDPISETLAPAFARATGGLGTLTVISGDEPDAGPDGGTDAGLPDGGATDAGDLIDAGGAADGGGVAPPHSGCGTGAGAEVPALAAALLVLSLLRRRNAA